MLHVVNDLKSARSLILACWHWMSDIINELKSARTLFWRVALNAPYRQQTVSCRFRLGLSDHTTAMFYSWTDKKHQRRKWKCSVDFKIWTPIKYLTATFCETYMVKMSNTLRSVVKPVRKGKQTGKKWFFKIFVGDQYFVSTIGSNFLDSWWFLQTSSLVDEGLLRFISALCLSRNCWC